MIATTPPSMALQGENREVLEQMRQAKHDAWSTIEHRLGDRELRE
jgi:ppGpp synthetase/RelA/SpoT-type nucleotidyltranferase